MAAVAAGQAAEARTSSTRTIRTASRWPALALSMSTQLAKPPLVASRRVDFHLQGNALSRWKYRQVDCFICASEAIRRMLVADGVAPRARSRCTRASISGASTRRRRRSSTRSCGCRTRADRRQRRRARAAQGSAASHRSRGARRPAGARRAVRHRRRRRAAAVARAPDQGPSPREARPARGLPARRPVAAQGVRHLRDELGHRRARHVAARRDGLRQADRRRPPAGFRRSSSTARPASSCRRAITRRWPTRS